MKFRWFVLEKRTPYEACVEPYQHAAPRGATSSRASTRVFIFSVSPAPLFRPTAHKACTRHSCHATRHAAPRATSTGGTAKRNAPRTRRRTTTGHEDKATSAPWPGRGRSSPPRQLVANAPPATDEQREKPAPPAPPRAWACERMRLREIDTATGTAADAAAGTAADTIDAVAQDTDRPTQHKLDKLQQTRTRVQSGRPSPPTCPGAAARP
jgi:hypothetical protein